MSTVMYPLAPFGVPTNDHRMIDADADLKLRAAMVPVLAEIGTGHAAIEPVGHLADPMTTWDAQGRKFLWARATVPGDIADGLMNGTLVLALNLTDAEHEQSDGLFTFTRATIAAVNVLPRERWTYADADMPAPVREA